MCVLCPPPPRSPPPGSGTGPGPGAALPPPSHPPQGEPRQPLLPPRSATTALPRGPLTAAPPAPAAAPLPPPQRARRRHFVYLPPPPGPAALPPLPPPGLSTSLATDVLSHWPRHRPRPTRSAAGWLRRRNEGAEPAVRLSLPVGSLRYRPAHLPWRAAGRCDRPRELPVTGRGGVDGGGGAVEGKGQRTEGKRVPWRRGAGPVPAASAIGACPAGSRGLPGRGALPAASPAAAVLAGCPRSGCPAAAARLGVKPGPPRSPPAPVPRARRAQRSSSCVPDGSAQGSRAGPGRAGWFLLPGVFPARYGPFGRSRRPVGVERGREAAASPLRNSR